MNSLAITIDYSDVPYLEELLSYLPIKATDNLDVNAYVKNITDSILVNYEEEQYQFAYFGLHLLYMTYIYFSVKKISVIIPERYNDAVAFAKPYHGQKIDFNDLESVFGYSLIPEKDLPNILKIIGLESMQVRKITELVEDKNEMFRANGRFTLSNDKSFNISAIRIVDSIANIHGCMEVQIRKWFADFLIRYCNNEFDEYSEISDILTEQMIEGFGLSAKELLTCNEMSVKELISKNPNFRNDLHNFKKALKKYCETMLY